ncbi:tetratricopeptide repeat protein [Daejeonella sp.]|uniref:tetratricopeptide repeat-containing sensor histidine kinase n=1 Tax=Daejeonella sp. TaxID=2805397 RepID=UPI0030BEE150
MSLVYALTFSPIKLYLFSNSTNIPGVNYQKDTLMVTRLNKKAFDSRLTDPQTAIQVAGNALQFAKRINHLPGIAEAYRVTGLGFSYLENNSMATKNYIEALRCYQQLNDDKNIAKTYNNIGSLYKYNDPDKALNYFSKALKIAGNIHDEELVAGMYFNIALIYSRKSEHNKSLVYFGKSDSIFRKLKDTISTIIYLQNTGRVYHKLHKIDSAKSRLNRAIQAAKGLQLYSTLSGCYLTLSYIYLEQGEFHLAEKAIEEGLKYARKVKNPVLDNDFIRVTYELELKRKDYQKALKYLSLAYHNDSLLLNENQSANIEINTRHYLQQQKIQEKELIITEQKYRAATNRWIITSGILLVLLSVIALLIWHYLREKRRKRDEIIIQSKINSLEQKALQAMMNPHFVFNVMNSIQHFMNQADARTANQVLSGFARLTRKHLEICMNSTISVHEELVYLQLYLSLEKIRFSDKMRYEVTIDKDIDTEEILIPSMLVQPFLENAIWHGIMPKEDGGLIKLQFTMDGTDVLISIVDDGVGISNSESLKKTSHISRGMALIRERVGLLNRLSKRHIFIDQQQTGEYGTAVLIRIPV